MTNDRGHCCPDAEALDRFASERLDAASASSISAHLAACRSCKLHLDDVRRNLEAASSFADFLRRDLNSSGAPTATADLTGNHPGRIEGFRIVREIGRGGMGVVYEAEQEHPRRRIALKIIRSDAWSAESLLRFEHEAQALARLQHPGIAQIHGASKGHTPDGARPYLAMEFVSGTPLGEYAKSHDLNLRDRLLLVAQICDAIQHAHQRGVIHRDLKPGNILVVDQDGSAAPPPDGTHNSLAHADHQFTRSRARPIVKILDFGVARLTNSDLRATTMQTDIGRLIGTIPYMSPEQACGDPAALDTRSDVYSLGVIAYELVTGRLPYKLEQRRIPEAVRAIREDEPIPPASVDRSLRGDVSTLLSKALEKDKERRYQSAGDFAADIRRYLADQPLSARPPSALYQFEKFAKRNRVLVGSTVLIALILVAGTIISLRLASRAMNAETKVRQQLEVVRRAQEHAVASAAESEQQAAKAVAVIEFLEDMLASANPEESGGRADATIRIVLDDAERKLDESSLANEPAIESMVRTTIGNTWRALGEYERANRSLLKAVEIGREVYPDGHADLAHSLNKLARVAQANGDYDRAEMGFGQSLEMRRRLYGDEHEDVATVLNNLGDLMRHQGRYEDAAELHERALRMRRRLFGDRHESVANSLNNYAVLLHAMGNSADAEVKLRESLEIDLAIRGRLHPNVSTTMINLAGTLGAQRKHKEAIELIREGIALRHEIYGATHPEIATALNNLAVQLSGDGQLNEAEQVYRESLEMDRSLRGEQHPDVANTLSNLAQVVSRQGRPVEARDLFQEALDICSVRLGANHPDTLGVMFHMARLHMAVNEFVRAESLLGELIPRMRSVLPEGNFRIGACLRDRGRCLAKLGRFDEAEPLLIEGYEIFRDAFGSGHPAAKGIAQQIADLLDATDRVDAAQDWRSKANVPEP